MTILETPRLSLRQMTPDDLPALKRTLQDPIAMTAYEHAFSDQEAQDWLDRQLARYQKDGFGLWAVVLKENNEMIGQCGLTIQNWKSKNVLEIGYLFQKAYWHKGYATEAAMACKEYAYTALDADAVYSMIRETNSSSQNVAVRIGMKIVDRDIKNFRCVDMNFLLYGIERGV